MMNTVSQKTKPDTDDEHCVSKKPSHFYVLDSFIKHWLS